MVIVVVFSSPKTMGNYVKLDLYRNLDHKGLSMGQKAFLTHSANSKACSVHYNESMLDEHAPTGACLDEYTPTGACLVSTHRRDRA